VILQQCHSDNQLVQTYQTILDQNFNGKNENNEQEMLRDFYRIVGSIITLYDPLPALSLAPILGPKKDLIFRRLGLLHSVLVVSDDGPIRPLHLSFRHILIDQSISDMNITVFES
jgi:hypothetical protein